jgi:hypothetical protein
MTMLLLNLIALASYHTMPLPMDMTICVSNTHHPMSEKDKLNREKWAMK